METEIEPGQGLADHIAVPSAANESGGSSSQRHHEQDRLVTVSIDGNEKHIPAGDYAVPQLKEKLGVPLDYELELVKGGKFEPLGDDQHYKVHGHEEFLSHVRCGGSSS